MPAPRILVVEDEPAIADAIVYALATDGFEPVWCATGVAALEQVRGRPPCALAILDVGLPDIHGFELLRQLQRHRPELPALFLTARSAEIDRVAGLELGADDYVAKPFSPRELVARVRTILRRAQRGAAAPAPPAAGEFEVDDERKRIRFRGVPLELSRIEYRLLKVLAERPGRVFSRDELMARAWDDPAAAFDRTVDAHVKLLRAKLRAIDPAADPIQTHRGMGYSLREP